MIDLAPKSFIEKTCVCGNVFYTTHKKVSSGRGVYCSAECKYKFRKRPSGLSYKIEKVNPTWIKKGQRLSINTEFKKGLIPHNFKEIGYGYHTVHDWVRRRCGKAKICSSCGSDQNVQWANKSYEYKRDLSDWIQLCRKCHIKYDRHNNAWGLATQKFNLK